MTALADGESISFDIFLSIRTGSEVVADENVAGIASGDPYAGTVPGGSSYLIDEVTEPGTFFGSYTQAGLAEIAVRVFDGEFDEPDFDYGSELQLWQLEFDGEFEGSMLLTFGYDETLFPIGFNESLLQIMHFNGLEWEPLPSTVDTILNVISASTNSLSPFTISLIPEPSTGVLAIAAAMCITLTRRRLATFGEGKRER